jgi:uncharacterized protein YqhQ
MGKPQKEKVRLGGMALANGVLVHGPTSWACAVRTEDGQIKVVARRKRLFGSNLKNPLLRGPVRLAEGFAFLPEVKRALPEAQLPFQDGRTLGMMAGAAVTGSVLRRHTRGIGGEAATAAVSLLPALFTLRSGDLAAYHGVEHKAIAAYEHGDQDAAEAAKEHDRCGSHLMAPLLAANVAGAALLKKVVERPRPVHGAALSLASVGLAVEVFAWSERHSASKTAKALRKPGHELQRVLGTREPSAEQLEVGRAALGEILRAEGCS